MRPVILVLVLTSAVDDPNRLKKLLFKTTQQK